MSLLHTINKSPFERNALQSCLRLPANGPASLLVPGAPPGRPAGGSRKTPMQSC